MAAILVVGGLVGAWLTPGITVVSKFDDSSLAAKQTYASAVMAGSSVATLLAAIAAGVFAKRAADQALRQADTAHQSLISSERAWLKVRLDLQGPAEWHSHGCLDVPVGVTIENVGRTPALNVHTNVKLLPSFADIQAKVSSLAADSKKVDTNNSRLLLPGDSYVRPWVPGIEPADSNPADYFCPTVIGCVTYQIVADKSLHQTAFCFVLDRVDAHGNSSGTFRPGEIVSASEIKILWWAGGFAD